MANTTLDRFDCNRTMKSTRISEGNAWWLQLCIIKQCKYIQVVNTLQVIKETVNEKDNKF